VELAQGKYQDFNDHHLTDKLEAKRRSSYPERRSAGFFALTGLRPPTRDEGSSTAAVGSEEPQKG